MALFEEGFFKRASSSLGRILRGLDLLGSLAITILWALFASDYLNTRDELQFVEAALPLTTTLIIVIVTSISIFVSLSDNEAMQSLRRDASYEKFLFSFELTAVLALLTSVFGILIKTVGVSSIGFHIFLFLFFYTVLSVATVISRIITYGGRIADLALAKSLPDDLNDKVTEIHDDSEDDTTKENSESEFE
jgi:hypothetical protein